MARSAMGANGEVALRMDETIGLTVRPRPVVLGDKDIAMLIGYRLDIADSCLYDRPYSRSETIQKIWEYENTYPVGKLTKKLFLDWVGDIYYLSNYMQDTDMHEEYDEHNESHQVLLELVHQTWPEFLTIKKTQGECEE